MISADGFVQACKKKRWVLLMNKFNCRTRERWSPEKTEWCRGRMVNDKHLEQAVVVELKRPIELELSPIEYDLPIKITPIIKCDSASSICNGSGIMWST